MNIIEREIELVEKNLLESLYCNNDFNNDIIKFLKLPSKRIRSKAGILYIKSQNREVTPQIIELLSAGELIHNASLLHDDVIDNSSNRRGETTISKKYSDKISVLSGNILLLAAIRKIMKLNNDNIFNLFIDCTGNMCNAEINQYLSRKKMISFDDYKLICEGKTASLFSAILKSVSILSNLDINTADTFAKTFGIIFQIRNDLEPISAQNDSINNLCTIKNIMSIENTEILIDNYKDDLMKIMANFPDNIYKKELKDLVKNL